MSTGLDVRKKCYLDQCVFDDVRLSGVMKFTEARILNDDESLLTQIPDSEYADCLQAIFVKNEHRRRTLQLDVCFNSSCSERGTQKCGRCMQTLYCSKQCQAVHWKVHKKDCGSDRLQMVTVFAERYAPSMQQQALQDALEENEDVDDDIAPLADTIASFAFTEATICPRWFLEQFKGSANIASLKQFTTEDTAMVIVSTNFLNYFQVPRRKEGLNDILPIMHQHGFYGDDFDELALYFLDLLFSRFPEIIDDGTAGGLQGINAYMQQYFGGDW